MSRVAAVLCALVPAACASHPGTLPHPHYVLGAPYQAAGNWHYPEERYDAVETGVASVYGARDAAVTADGEQFDQSALAAAHPTLQLPAIARLTNLDNGRQVVVRINDRGPADPHRLIQVTRRAATLLGFPADGLARVELQVLSAESHAATEFLPGAPGLAIAAAPRAVVREIPLADSAAPAAPPQPAATVTAAETPPLRLPETVTQTAPVPTSLWVQLGSFQGYRYAAVQRTRLASLGAEIVASDQGGQQEYRVRLGPFTTISQADVALDRAIGAGVADAHIVAESGP